MRKISYRKLFSRRNIIIIILSILVFFTFIFIWNKRSKPMYGDDDIVPIIYNNDIYLKELVRMDPDVQPIIRLNPFREPLFTSRLAKYYMVTKLFSMFENRIDFRDEDCKNKFEKQCLRKDFVHLLNQLKSMVQITRETNNLSIKSNRGKPDGNVDGDITASNIDRMGPGELQDSTHNNHDASQPIYEKLSSNQQLASSWDQNTIFLILEDDVYLCPNILEVVYNFKQDETRCLYACGVGGTCIIIKPACFESILERYVVSDKVHMDMVLWTHPHKYYHAADHFAKESTMGHNDGRKMKCKR